MQSSLGSPTASSIVFFFLIVALTLVVTYWAARRTKTSSEFYAAGRSVSALQNGFALAGDYMSAASFLGISGMVALQGYDGMIYATGWLVGWPALMFLIAEPLRNLGKFTFADVVAFRLQQRPVRIAAAIGGILTVLFYTIAQMVGSGQLINLMFGIPYEWAEIIVGSVMLAYVLFGGMLATTWVQIIKAVLLLIGVIGPDRARAWPSSAGARPTSTARSTAKYGQGALQPGGFVSSPLEAVSLGLALMFGLLGLPHILMRFYTVPDAKAARKSVLYATGLIGYFYVIIPIVGFGAAVLVGRDVVNKIDPGGNMAAPLLGELLGGQAFLGFISAVAFATILAVVAGLTLAGASAFSPRHLRVRSSSAAGPARRTSSRWPASPPSCFGVCAIALGIALQGPERGLHGGPGLRHRRQRQLPGPAHVHRLEAASPPRGAIWSILVGAFSSVAMIVLSPTVWVDIFKFQTAVFPLKNPAIFSMTLAFAVGIVVSLLTPEKEAQEKFEDEKVRTYLGVGAE